jgi:hypothetical protein
MHLAGIADDELWVATIGLNIGTMNAGAINAKGKEVAAGAPSHNHPIPLTLAVTGSGNMFGDIVH